MQRGGGAESGGFGAGVGAQFDVPVRMVHEGEVNRCPRALLPFGRAC